MIFNNHIKNSIGSAVTDIEYLKLRLNTMRLTEEYELKVNGNVTEISYYTMTFSSGSGEMVLRKRTTCDTQELIDILNSVDFVSWNGFSGKHPVGVLDGTMFNLTATLNTGQKLRADGSQNFPKHFHDFEKWLREMLE